MKCWMSVLCGCDFVVTVHIPHEATAQEHIQNQQRNRLKKPFSKYLNRICIHLVHIFKMR
jgi:hypothetical protein